jgi:hypothetical protein
MGRCRKTEKTENIVRILKHENAFVRKIRRLCEVLTEVTMNTAVFWDVKQHSLVEVHRAKFLHLQGGM